MTLDGNICAVTMPRPTEGKSIERGEYGGPHGSKKERQEEGREARKEGRTPQEGWPQEGWQEAERPTQEGSSCS